MNKDRLPAATGAETTTADERIYWRSVDEHARLSAAGSSALAEQQAAAQQAQSDEFAPGAAELELDPVARRDFLGVMGASFALAGVSLSGCVRKPKENILPYTRRPEELIPGKPRLFATAAQLTGSVIGLLVESQDGRPTKIEGNPAHPNSLGATDIFAQAAVLDLYSPDRLKRPRMGTRDVSLSELDAALSAQLAALRAKQGDGLALLLPQIDSPTLHKLVAEIRHALPHARFFRMIWPASAKPRPVRPWSEPRGFGQSTTCSVPTASSRWMQTF